MGVVYGWIVNVWGEGGWRVGIPMWMTVMVGCDV